MSLTVTWVCNGCGLLVQAEREVVPEGRTSAWVKSPQSPPGWETFCEDGRLIDLCDGCVRARERRDRLEVVG